MGWLIFIIAFALIIGSALILLRSANIPRLPSGIQAQPYQDDED